MLLSVDRGHLVFESLQTVQRDELEAMSRTAHLSHGERINDDKHHDGKNLKVVGNFMNERP